MSEKKLILPDNPPLEFCATPPGLLAVGSGVHSNDWTPYFGSRAILSEFLETLDLDGKTFLYTEIDRIQDIFAAQGFIGKPVSNRSWGMGETMAVIEFK